MILVTGGSGHLGANLVRRLLADGQALRLLYRPGSDNRALDDLPVERVEGDLRDPAAMARAVAGCERVYHCAARISTVAGGEREIFDCNVVGTRNVLAAARAAGVRRVVVSGSLSAVGFEHGKPSNEDMLFYPFEVALPYEWTKALVELECWRAAAAGLEVVVATSCAIIGPHDYKPSRMGRALLDYAGGRMRAYLPGGFEFVAARDIVEGHLLAMSKGRSGQKYIFGSGYVSIDEMVATWRQVTGRPPPRLRLPPKVVMAIARVASPLMTRFAPGQPQRLTPDAVRLLQQHRSADCTKARTELGYQPTSVHQAIAEAYQDFVRRGLIVPLPGAPSGTPGRVGSPAAGGAPPAPGRDDKAGGGPSPAGVAARQQATPLRP